MNMIRPAIAALAIFAVTGAAHAQSSTDTTTQPPVQAIDCPAPGTVPEAQIPENCKTQNQNNAQNPAAGGDNMGASGSADTGTTGTTGTTTTDTTGTTGTTGTTTTDTTGNATTTTTDQTTGSTSPAETTGTAVQSGNMANGMLASRLIGQTVYSQADENVGEINDLVISPDGQTIMAIIGVGGFLGIGEKDVAVNFNELNIGMTENNTMRVAMNATKEQLEAAPSYARDKSAVGTNMGGDQPAQTNQTNQ